MGGGGERETEIMGKSHCMGFHGNIWLVTVGYQMGRLSLTQQGCSYALMFFCKHVLDLSHCGGAWMGTAESSPSAKYVCLSVSVSNSGEKRLVPSPRPDFTTDLQYFTLKRRRRREELCAGKFFSAGVQLLHSHRAAIFRSGVYNPKSLV